MSICYNQSRSIQWARWIYVACTAQYLTLLDQFLSLAGSWGQVKWEQEKLLSLDRLKKDWCFCIFRSKKVAAPVSLPTLSSTSGPASNELTAAQPKVMPSVREWKERMAYTPWSIRQVYVYNLQKPLWGLHHWYQLPYKTKYNSCGAADQLHNVWSYM